MTYNVSNIMSYFSVLPFKLKYCYEIRYVNKRTRIMILFKHFIKTTNIILILIITTKNKNN